MRQCWRLWSSTPVKVGHALVCAGLQRGDRICTHLWISKDCSSAQSNLHVHPWLMCHPSHQFWWIARCWRDGQTKVTRRVVVLQLLCSLYSLALYLSVCHPPMSKTAPRPQQPCYCPRCKGALVSRKTIQNHAKLFPNPLPTLIPWFQDWLNLQAGRSGERDEDMNSCSSEQDSDEHPGENERDDKESDRSPKRPCTRQPEHVRCTLCIAL